MSDLTKLHSARLARLDAALQQIENTAHGDAAATAAKGLKRLLARLARPPRLVLLGEFNAGKSSLANLLLGRHILPTGVLATVHPLLLLRYRERPEELFPEQVEGGARPLDPLAPLSLGPAARLVEIGLPDETLRRFEILDTPGISSRLIADEKRMIAEASGRAHIALWCTLASQAWKASELANWLQVPDRLRRRSLLVATRADALGSEADRIKLVSRLQREAGPLFGGVVLISARDAMQARESGGAIADPHGWRASGAEEFESRLSALLASVQAERMEAAEQVGARIARRAPANIGEADGAPPPDRDAFLKETLPLLTAPFAADGADIAALTKEAAERLAVFRRQSFEPWLKQKATRAEAAAMLALLPAEETLAAALQGCKPEDAAQHLTRVLLQIQAEIGSARLPPI